MLWLLTALCMVGIFMFSSQNGERSTDTSDEFIETVLQTVIDDYDERDPLEIKNIVDSLSFIVRKSAHFSIYCLLGILTSCAVGRYGISRRKRFIYALLICAAYATSDEIHQYFVPGRACLATDVLIDSCGSTLGILLTLAASSLGQMYIRRHRQNEN